LTIIAVAVIATVIMASLVVRGRSQRMEIRRGRDRQERLERALADLSERAGTEAPLGDDHMHYEGPMTPDIPESLVEACVEGDCLLFAGAGLSAQAGLPTWEELVGQVIELHADEDPDDWRTLAERVGSIPNQIAEIVGARVPQEQLVDDVLDVQQRSARREVSIFRDLSRIPFTGAVTTNYDDLLEGTFSARSPVALTLYESEDLPTFLREKRFVVLKLYGNLDRPASFLFTPADYAVALGSNASFERTVASLFLSNTVLFIGVSLEGIDNFFAGLRMRYDVHTRQHYALVPWHKDVAVEQERFRVRYGIELIPYAPAPGHPAAAAFVARLAERTSGRSSAAGPRAALQSAQIESVQLENVGPFLELELNLNRQWNVLLGDNGSGKSTLLRAIALALCGDDERAHGVGARLLRAGARSGLIEVRVGADVYRTELIRETSGVSVKSSQLTPLQAGASVILGFPSVRGVTTRNPPPTIETSRHPLVSDVLPLLVGVADARLDDIKGWLVSQSLRAEGGRGVTHDDAARAGKLIESFFDLVNDLTPGLRLEFDSCDRSTWQVMVRTIDGTIPIDLVSQGTISVLGWAGTLLQRMHEIYPDSHWPESEPAIVLVDELDAHMHPGWQRVLIPVLKDRLPKLQLIGTTHSPLVVGGMEPSEVTRFRRLEDSPNNIVVEPIIESLKGMRADQILTSPAFDLDTTRDTATVLAMHRYSELLGISRRTAQEEAEFAALSRNMREAVPTFPETPLARTSLSVLEKAILQQLQDRPAEEKQQILDEADRYMAEIMPRSERS
jgi:energy-coupling factor transporter ATP-binding protein EcfA2